MKGILKYSLLLCCIFLSGCKTEKASRSIALEKLTLEELTLEIETLRQKTTELEALRKQKFPDAIATSESEDELLMLLAKDSTIIVKGKLKQNKGINLLTISQPLSYKVNLEQKISIEIYQLS